MRDVIKYIAFIVIVAASLIVAMSICAPDYRNDVTLDVPSDTNYVPVIKRAYRPQSLPFTGSPVAPVRLPRGTSSSDFKKAVQIIKTKHTTAGVFIDTTIVLIDKTDKIFVQRTDSTETVVTDITFLSPILNFVFSPGAGLSLSKHDDAIVASPVVVVRFVEIYGNYTIDARVATSGLGFGVGYKIDNRFQIALALNYRYEDLSSFIGASLTYHF